MKLAAKMIIAFMCIAVQAYGKGRVDVICHYMTWFKYQTDETGNLQVKHWKWQGKKTSHDPAKSINDKTRDIYSIFYPKIGVYDSSDPTVIDYHILTAKTAGISAFVIDWYNRGDNVDKSFEKVLRHCKELNYKAAICYEEKNCFPDWNKISTRQEAVAKAVEDFKYIKDKYLNDPGYWKKNNKPVILVFSGWGEWENKGKKLFTDAEWKQIIDESKINAYIVLQNFQKDYTTIKAGFAWCGDNAYTKWFYQVGDRLLQEKIFDFYIGSACPGFDDRGTWGWDNNPRFEAYLGLENFNRYLRDFDSSDSDVLQVVTWNDFAEGTMIEPSAQFGNMYVERLGEWNAQINKKIFQPGSTSLPYKWFFLAKKLGNNHMAVKQIKELLIEGNYQQVNKAIIENTATSKISIPPYIDIKNEFKPYTNNYK
ncbi:MAG: hypothetical protein JXR78_09575 [Victivallales bacterium]|nr:hypothetical protein [Victivallales bacterium]